MSETIEPEPSDAEREAIREALARPAEAVVGEWGAAALLEGVESGEPEP